MVQVEKCECKNRHPIKINSLRVFNETKEFFEEQIDKGVYKEVTVKEPFYVGKSDLQTIPWYANKWYVCRVCGCLWEFDYPDFPAIGFVRKFEDGKYRPKDTIRFGEDIR